LDVFNELGRKLSEGFYWVRNTAEMDQTLAMLLSGYDPLREKRNELANSILFMPEGGAGLGIKEAIASDFHNVATSCGQSLPIAARSPTEMEK